MKGIVGWEICHWFREKEEAKTKAKTDCSTDKRMEICCNIPFNIINQYERGQADKSHNELERCNI